MSRFIIYETVEIKNTSRALPRGWFRSRLSDPAVYAPGAGGVLQKPS